MHDRAGIWSSRDQNNRLTYGYDPYPAGSCDPGENHTKTDPENCFMYYQCDNGCVTHEECPDDMKYDDE